MEEVLGFIGQYYLLPMRFVFVLLVILIIINLKRRMSDVGGPEYLLAVLDIENGSSRVPIFHYETTIGRSKACDVTIPFPAVSRQHAVLTMAQNGMWRILDTGSKSGLLVNGKKPDPDTLIGIGDSISLAGVAMELTQATPQDVKLAGKKLRREKGEGWFARFRPRIFKERSPRRLTGSVFALLNLFQVLACIQLLFALDQEYMLPLLVSFGFLFVLPWVHRLAAKVLKIKNMAAETAAMFLVTIGFCTTASASPESLIKQLLALIFGILLFYFLCGILKNLDLVMKLRPYGAVISLGILAVNLILGVTINGQKNWIDLGFTTIQPSEFVKILFVFVGAATLEWLLTTKNLTMLMIYALGCMGLLVIMGDFGTAIIFFFAFLVLIFMTSGDIRAIVLTCISAGMGGVLVLTFKPYILDRFSAWRHVWSYVNATGFQQTRALMAIASGGLLGIGGGNGFFRRVYAADTDVVFGMLVEEWGLIIALLVPVCYMLLLLAAIRSHRIARSSYYVIAACTAASIFLFQAALNIFGTTDILPITGVTLPFVSNGGSSLMASWGMLSFITAALNFTRPKTVNDAQKTHSNVSQKL